MERQSLNSSRVNALKRKARVKNLLDKGTKLQNEIKRTNTMVTLHSVKSIIQESNEIINEGDPLDRLGNSSEIVMDMQLVQTNHKIISEIMDKNSEFNQEMFINAINELVRRDDYEDWTAITEIVCGIAHTVRAKPSMVGALKLEPSIRTEKQRQLRKRATLTQETTPEDVKSLKRNDHGAEKINQLHREFTRIYKANNCEAIPLYKLIIDPDNLMRTVQCAFQLSFLVRDNALAVEKGEDGYPLVRLTTSKERERQKETKHFFCRVDEKTCTEMIRYYNIREPMISTLCDGLSQQ